MGSDQPASGMESASDRMAAARTTLALHRTRLSGDRTLMASLRTSLSMIGFGFTIFSFFRSLRAEDLLGGAIPGQAPARFGLALVILGIVMLVIGIWSELRYMRMLRQQRDGLIRDGLLAGGDSFPRSLTLINSFLLLLLGLFALLSITARVGPFQ